MSIASLSSEYRIEVQTWMHRQVLLVPRHGIKNIVILNRPVSLSRVRFSERAYEDEKPGAPGVRR